VSNDGELASSYNFNAVHVRAQIQEITKGERMFRHKPKASPPTPHTAKEPLGMRKDHIQLGLNWISFGRAWESSQRLFCLADLLPAQSRRRAVCIHLGAGKQPRIVDCCRNRDRKQFCSAKMVFCVQVGIGMPNREVPNTAPMQSTEPTAKSANARAF